MMKPSTIVKRINKMGFQAFLSSENVALVSAENGDDAGDYYGEFRGGYPWINPKIEKFTKKNNLYIEWENPGTFGIYSN